MVTDEPLHVVLPRRGGRRDLTFDGRFCSLYVVVSADDRRAKVGMVSDPSLARRRRSAIERAAVRRGVSPAERPYRMAVVGEIEGLGYLDDNEARWTHIDYQVQAMEHAVRLVMSAEVKGFDDAYEWLVLNGRHHTNRWWARQLLDAWDQVQTIAPAW